MDIDMNRDDLTAKLAEIREENILLGFGLGFALCNFDHMGTREDVKKCQSYHARIEVMLGEIDAMVNPTPVEDHL